MIYLLHHLQQSGTVDAEFDGTVDDAMAVFHLFDDDFVFVVQFVVLASHTPNKKTDEHNEHRDDAREQ